MFACLSIQFTEMAISDTIADCRLSVCVKSVVVRRGSVGGSIRSTGRWTEQMRCGLWCIMVRGVGIGL